MRVKKIVLPYNGFERAVFKNCSVYIPSKTDEHLASHYGKDYMIPNPVFDPDHLESTTFYTYEENPGIGVFLELPI